MNNIALNLGCVQWNSAVQSNFTSYLCMTVGNMHRLLGTRLASIVFPSKNYKPDCHSSHAACQRKHKCTEKAYQVEMIQSFVMRITFLSSLRYISRALSQENIFLVNANSIMQGREVQHNHDY